MKRELPKLATNTYDDLFSTEEQRNEAKLEKVSKIPLSEIQDFDGHPFSVRMDEDMVKLINSIQENGMVMPVLVRPHKGGTGYEMISGHRRKFALEQIGFDTVDAIIRDLDDDQATILMVDSNVQREHILPSERGYAYKMRLDAMKHQGKRNDLTSRQFVDKLEYSKKIATDELSEALGVHSRQIQRYIRLTELIKPLQQMVDETHEDGFIIAFNPAYELSFLKPTEQKFVVEAIHDSLATPSLAQAQEFKRKSQNSELTKEFIFSLLMNEKPNQKEKLSFKTEEVDRYFLKTFTPKQKKETIIKLLENWQKKREKEQVR